MAEIALDVAKQIDLENTARTEMLKVVEDLPDEESRANMRALAAVIDCSPKAAMFTLASMLLVTIQELDARR